MLPTLFYFVAWFLLSKIAAQILTVQNLQSTYLGALLKPYRLSLDLVPDLNGYHLCIDMTYYSSIDKPMMPITLDEAASIRLYTAKCGIHRILNIALRTEKDDQIVPWFPYLKLFHTALIKLPPRDGDYCRGEIENRTSSYRIGATVKYWAVTSLSSDPEVCLEFLKGSSHAHLYYGVLYWISSFSAREISKFSDFPFENEFVLLPATTMVVMDMRPSPIYKEVYEVYLQEIDTVPRTTTTKKIFVSKSSSSSSKRPQALLSKSDRRRSLPMVLLIIIVLFSHTLHNTLSFRQTAESK